MKAPWSTSTLRLSNCIFMACSTPRYIFSKSGHSELT